jgi:hypothetical protein
MQSCDEVIWSLLAFSAEQRSTPEMILRSEFSISTQKAALKRQKNRCASCGEKITKLGNAGRGDHKFDEGVQAHHLKHCKLGGTNTVSNCVILCWSCHYSAHEGGNYRGGTVIGRPKDFPHFNG